MNKNKMKVFHVLTDKNIGGAGRWLLYYLKYFDKQKFSVTVVLAKDSMLVSQVKNLSIPVIALEQMQESSYDKQSVKAFQEIFKKEKPDIVHTHASFSARLAAKRAKVPVIVFSKHWLEKASNNAVKRKIKGFINRYYSNCVIAVSDAVKNSLIAEGTKAERIVTIYNGIEELALSSKQEQKQLREKYGLKEEDIVIGIVARLEEVKDHPTFFKAAKETLKRYPKTKFLVIGNGSKREEYEHLVKKLEIENHVVFTGHVEQIEKLMSILDLNVITSLEEALCLSILEGLSLGIPTIGTNSGGTSEIIKEGYNGEMILVGDIRSLTKKFSDFIENREKWQQYGQNGKNTVLCTFLASDMTKKIDNLYEQLLSGERTRL